METTVDNIISYTNLLTITKKIISGVGFELQAPLDDATLDEIVASSVMSAVGERAGETK